MDLFEVFDEEGAPVALSELPGARVLAGDETPEPMIVRNIVRATGQERWLLNKATAVRDEQGRIAMAINVIDDITLTKRRELDQRLLAEALRALSSSPELDDTLRAVADSTVPGLADWAGVDLVDERGDLRTVAVAHRDPEKVRLGWELRRHWPVDSDAASGLGAVARTGRPEITRDITDEMLVAGARDEEHLALLRRLGLRSTMIVPMTAGDEVVGTLSFASSTGRRFDHEDLNLAAELGRQAGVAVRNAQLFAQRREIAHTLQAGLLPGGLPDIPDWDLAAFYRPAGLANEAGGDFYDAVRAPDGWVLVIGDVAGKGALAAALTAVARYTLRTAIQLTGDPQRALAYLNDVLLARDELSLCTAALLRLPDEGSEVEVTIAGHPFPLHRSATGVRPLGETGPMLGAFGDARWRPRRATLAPDDGVVLFTDGILDTVGADGRFGGGRLEAVVAAAGRTADELVAAVRDAADDFCDGPQPDDVALLAVRRAPVRVAG
jgi:serine phosphatase RsbU (regulator of sigma subunit)/PAS domain-containing protein